MLKRLLKDLRSYEKDNKTCHGLFLHYMTDSFYIYSKTQNAIKFSKVLNSQYDLDDTRIRKYACSRRLSFKMTNDKPILEQVHAYESLCAKILVEVRTFVISFKPITY